MTVDNLEERVPRHEQLMKIQGGLDDPADQTFFTHTQHFMSGPSLTKKEQHQRDVEYTHDLRARTKCYSCGDIWHLSADCRQPCTPRPAGKTNPTKIDYGLSAGNLAESLRVDSDTANSDDDYAFMVTSVMHSYAFYSNSSSVTWYADSGASDHMTDRLDYFTSFNPIPEGPHPVQVADNLYQILGQRTG